jgi:hypothetical protein
LSDQDKTNRSQVAGPGSKVKKMALIAEILRGQNGIKNKKIYLSNPSEKVHSVARPIQLGKRTRTIKMILLAFS